MFAQIAALSLPSRQLDLPGPELLPSRLMRATAQVLPVAGAGLSLFSDHHRVPLGASDDTAVLAERLQFTVGEGPCLTAHVQDRAVVATAHEMAIRWPIFHNELLTHTPYRAIVSLPIDIDKFRAGAAMDLYYTEPQPQLSQETLEEIETATDIITALLVANSGLIDDPDTEPTWLTNDAAVARSQVWIAIGMLNVALNLPADQALATLRSYAYGRNRTIDDIARNITDRELPVEALAP